MSNDQDENAQNNDQQIDNSALGSGNLPEPDPDLSDYHKRDVGSKPKIERR